MLDFPAVGSKNQQKIPNKPPILNQIRLRNQLQIGLSKPNLRPRFHTKTPYTAGAAAQNVQLQPESSPKNFRRANQAPSPEPLSLSRGPQPYRLNPTSAEPYGRALAKTKTLARHTAKTHSFYPPTPPPTGPEPPPQKQVL